MRSVASGKNIKALFCMFHFLLLAREILWRDKRNYTIRNRLIFRRNVDWTVVKGGENISDCCKEAEVRRFFLFLDNNNQPSSHGHFNDRWNHFRGIINSNMNTGCKCKMHL